MVRNFKAPFRRTANQIVFRLWFVEKSLQLIVSQEVIEEYLDVLERVIKADRKKIAGWQACFAEDARCTLVGLGRRYTESRDPDDNVFLATALAGRADYLITNDRDLLDLPVDFQRSQPFAIVSPREFLRMWREP